MVIDSLHTMKINRAVHFSSKACGRESAKELSPFPSPIVIAPPPKTTVRCRISVSLPRSSSAPKARVLVRNNNNEPLTISKAIAPFALVRRVHKLLPLPTWLGRVETVHAPLGHTAYEGSVSQSQLRGASR